MWEGRGDQRRGGELKCYRHTDPPTKWVLKERSLLKRSTVETDDRVAGIVETDDIVASIIVKTQDREVSIILKTDNRVLAFYSRDR